MFLWIVSFVNLCVAVYLVVSLIRPLGLKRSVKIILSFLILCASQYLWISFIASFFFNRMNPFSFGFISVSGVLQVVLFVFFLWAVVMDGIALILRLMKRPFVHRIVFISVGAVFMSVLGIYEAIKVPVVRYVTIYSDMLPHDWKSATIAVLSDIHIGSDTQLEKKWLQQTVAKTNALHPDMILVTGDIIDGSVEFLNDQIRPLFDLSAKDGVYLTFGNHETYRGAGAWETFFRQNAVRVLNDEVISVSLNTNPIKLAGIYRNSALLNTELNDSPILLMAHYPAVAKKIPADKVFLQLSGHTHGGQFAFLYPLVALGNEGFVRGLYQLGRSQLYVHSGTGLWRGFPFRFLTPSEITLMTIRRK